MAHIKQFTPRTRWLAHLARSAVSTSVYVIVVISGGLLVDPKVAHAARDEATISAMAAQADTLLQRATNTQDLQLRLAFQMQALGVAKNRVLEEKAGPDATIQLSQIYTHIAETHGAMNHVDGVHENYFLAADILEQLLDGDTLTGEQRDKIVVQTCFLFVAAGRPDRAQKYFANLKLNVVGKITK